MNADRIMFIIAMVFLGVGLAIAVMGVLICGGIITGPTWLVNV